ncbi:hypothetical protein [Lentihominibacter sp.]|uniref:hypothetical protein n=1 Tax=Lentihominibacter sp. TaxID=2944216 RepID=UPI0039923123
MKQPVNAIWMSVVCRVAFADNFPLMTETGTCHVPVIDRQGKVVLIIMSRNKSSNASPVPIEKSADFEMDCQSRLLDLR